MGRVDRKKEESAKASRFLSLLLRFFRSSVFMGGEKLWKKEGKDEAKLEGREIWSARWDAVMDRSMENAKKIGRFALKRGYLTCRGHIVVCVGVNVNDL